MVPHTAQSFLRPRMPYRAFGFVVATGMLHAIGILIGTIRAWHRGATVLRAGGAAIALIGVYYLIRAWTS